MAKANSFNVEAYLASTATEENRPSLAAVVANKFENVVQRASYRAGKVSESLGGTGEIFDLGKKVGRIDAAARTEEFRARAAAEIRARIGQ